MNLLVGVARRPAMGLMQDTSISSNGDRHGWPQLNSAYNSSAEKNYNMILSASEATHQNHDAKSCTLLRSPTSTLSSTDSAQEALHISHTSSYELLPKFQKCSLYSSRSQVLLPSNENDTFPQPGSTKCTPILRTILPITLSLPKKVKRNRRNLSFSNVEIREYNIVIGDNPSCSSGIPVSLGWDHTAANVLLIDVFEKYRGPQRRSVQEMKMNAFQRRNVLRRIAGYKERDMVKAERRLKNQRRSINFGTVLNKC